MKNMPQLLWWQTSKPEDVSTCECGPGKRKLGVFCSEVWEWKGTQVETSHNGEKTRKRAMKNKSTNNYETE